ncbi:sarcosine dehydrogenase, mitochondrial [Cloeon dipterum]|uniref:sarcosine dehydrogenase, mitochondrial n=1 Tax=Cloeon dipterum TaxID=197152 RepID=UPI00321FBCFF
MLRAARSSWSTCLLTKKARLAVPRQLATVPDNHQEPVETPTLPESADVVIIGGGSAGCNTLYQLARRGVRAVLLEKARLTAGTTWHTAGLIWRLRPNDVEIQLLATTRDLLMRLEAETGIDPGWINNGGLFIAHSKERLDEYRRLATAGRFFGIESQLLSPAETSRLFPLIDEKALYGALYSPGDGTVDPTGMCAALTKAASRSGGRVIEGCSVSGIQVERNMFGTKQISAVKTPFGTIKTECVVNCAGVWAREIAAMVGQHIPLVPMKHAYVVTEEVPGGARTLPNVRDHDSSVYFRVQGDALCVGGYEPNPIILDSVAKDFMFGLYELDWDVFGVHVRGAVQLAPLLETTGIKSTVCGPESFTPDHKPLLGEDPKIRGFFYGCGFNSSGMMLGGGCGEQLAQWIINGRPELAMYAYDIRRFTTEQRKDVAWAKERSHESYAKNYSIVFPHDEPLAGRNFKQGPFHKELLEEGCVFQERLGWERPGWFTLRGPAPVPKYDWYGAYGNSKNPPSVYKELLQGDYSFGHPEHHHVIGQECHACRNQVALFDMSYFGKLYLSGPEAQLAADWLFTADTQRPIGRTVYTCSLNKRGGVEADLTVSAIETGHGGQVDPIFKGRGFYLAVGGASAQHSWAHINWVLKERQFKAQVSDLSQGMGLLSIQGPNSRALLQNLVDTDLNNDSFPFSTTKLVRVAGHLCRAMRISFVGELGWELHIPIDSCKHVYRAIVHEGKKHGLRHAGYRAIDSLSAEKGFHLWNVDLRSDDNPLEAGLGFTCRKSGSDYLGRAAVEETRKKGLAKKRVFFELKEQVPVWGLEAVYRDGVVVGYLRRGEFGFTLNASVGFGYIRRPDGLPVTNDFVSSGKYEIEVMGDRIPAVAHLKSPFDPAGKRVQGIYDD